MSIKDDFQWYLLTANDAWFFRDGRPMNRGEDARGVQSLFPPTMETLVGGFRAALAREQGWKGYGDWPQGIKSVLGSGFDDLGKLSFLGPLLTLDDQPVFPCPGHLLIDEVTQTPTAWLTPSAPSDRAICDLGAVSLPLPPKRGEGQAKLGDSSGYYLTLAGFKNVLRGQLPKREELLKEDSLFAFETRVGIARDESTRTVKDGALYNPTFVRLKRGVGLMVGASGLPEGWHMPSSFPLGGEARMASCRKLDRDLLQGLAGLGSGRLMLSITPTIFYTDNDNGAKSWYGPLPGEKAFLLDHNLTGDIITVCCNRPVLIPRWDSLKGHPRNQLLAVPPGSVWWLSEKASLSGFSQIGFRKGHGYGLVVVASAAGEKNE